MFTREPERVIKETYSPELIREINQEDIRAFAAEMSFNKAKVVLAGKNLLSRDEITG